MTSKKVNRYDPETVKTILAKAHVKRFELEEIPNGTIRVRTDTPLKQDVLNELFRATGLGWSNAPFHLPEPEPDVHVSTPEGQAKLDTSKGVKYDGGKPQMGLISSAFLKGLATVLTRGAEKYAPHNWRKGFILSRPYNALQRHLTDWNAGQDFDEETGLPVLYHAACELMFLCELAETHPELDDRFKGRATTAAPRIPSEGQWIMVEVDGKDVAAFVPKMLTGDQAIEARKVFIEG